MEGNHVMASLSIRIKIDAGGQIGPGKVNLLEQIAVTGSISAAARKMAMSYRRAWQLVDELNALFETPVVERQVGGKNGGGAELTPLGRSLVESYRYIEEAAAQAARDQLDDLQHKSGKKIGGTASAA